MDDKQKGYIPQVAFGHSELQGIEGLLRGYSQYLQKSPASPKNAKRVQTLEKIRGRLASQLAAGKSKDVEVFLDLEEIEELLTALREFATAVKRVFPKNEERDSVIAAVNAWYTRLTHIMNEFGV